MKKFLFIIFLPLMVQTALSQEPILVVDFNGGPDGSFSSSNFKGISIGDRLILPVQGNDQGLEPGVVHNGQLNILLDIYEGETSSSPGYFTTFEEEVYFSAFDPDNGGSIWVTDGTADGTEVKFTHGGSHNQRPQGLIIDDAGYLYYTAKSTLYRTNGETLDSIFSGINFTTSMRQRSYNYGLYRGNVAFVRISDSSIELFVVEDGTVELKSSLELSRTGDLWGLSEVQEGLIFGMDVIPFFAEEFGTYVYTESTGTISKYEIAGEHARRIMGFNEELSLGWVAGNGYYMVNGRSGQEVRVVNSPLISFQQGNIIEHALLGDQMAFIASLSELGSDYLYLTDGTIAGTSQLHEVDAYQSNMVKKNNYAFIASGTSNGFTPDLFAIDAEEGNSYVLHSFSRQSLQLNSVQLVAVHDDKLYFTSNLDPDVGRELYFIELGLFVNTENPTPENRSLDVSLTNRTFELRTSEFLPYDLEIFSLSGQLIESSIRTTNTTYDFNHLKGVYIFRFTMGEKVLSKKVFCAGGY